MAPRHPAALNRSSSVCNLSARKLIIFVSVQLVLSPFISITADTLNGGTNNEAAMHQRIDASVSSAKTNGLGDVFVTRVIQAPRKNSSEMATSRQRPYDLSPTGNASIRNQSEQTISASRPKREHATFNKDSERVLSRKRRYLIFPPGSSLHIVHDTYHPIVDHSNLLILGITAAMAWELPSKPVYLDEELRESYQMGELPLLHRNDKNVSNAQYAVPSNENANTIDSNYYYTNVPKQKYAYDKYQSPYNPNYPYQSPVYKSSYQTKYNPFYPTPAPSNRIQNYISYADNVMKQFKKLTEKIPQDRPLNSQDFQELANIIAKNVKPNSKSKYAQRNTYNHIIHPAFKKRSTDTLSALEKFDLNLHRNSRHALYKQINTFLETQGSDGDECVLKMLCETGQRQQNEKPGSMVIELLRAVFTLPEPLEPTNHPEHKKYDEAHASTADCQQQYPKCKETVWSSKYM